MARGSGKTLYYWDSCIFIAHVKNEVRPAEQTAGIEGMAKQADDGDAVIVTSVLTTIEFLDCTMTPAQQDMFRRLFKRTNVQAQPCDQRVANKAHEIRNYYKAKGSIVSTPDAIHLATAIIYEVEGFYTFDGEGKLKPGRKAKLIPLSGDVAGIRLKIATPLGTPSLFTGTPKLKTSSASTRPSLQSPAAEPPSSTAPAPDRPEGPQAAPGPPQPDSFPDEPPPSPSEQ